MEPACAHVVASTCALELMVAHLKTASLLQGRHLRLCLSLYLAEEKNGKKRNGGREEK
jgi:hypothetical protein